MTTHSQQFSRQQFSRRRPMTDVEAALLASDVIEDARQALRREYSGGYGRNVSAVVRRSLRLPLAVISTFPEYVVVAACLLISIAGLLLHGFR